MLSSHVIFHDPVIFERCLTQVTPGCGVHIRVLIFNMPPQARGVVVLEANVTLRLFVCKMKAPVNIKRLATVGRYITFI